MPWHIPKNPKYSEVRIRTETPSKALPPKFKKASIVNCLLEMHMALPFNSQISSERKRRKDKKSDFVILMYVYVTSLLSGPPCQNSFSDYPLFPIVGFQVFLLIRFDVYLCVCVCVLFYY